jgi:HD-GYP domain-containing protein (c-di-GMP phosphodiesterase class II)
MRCLSVLFASSLRQRWDYPALPDALVRYVGAISILGPTIAIAVALWYRPTLDLNQAMLFGLLIVLATVAERFPLHLTHKMNCNAATAVYIAMVLLLPVAVCPLAALIAVTAAQAWRMHVRSDIGFAEPAFNIGQTALYVGFAALTGHLVSMLWPTQPHLGDIPVATLILMTAAMHLANTALVSHAASLQQAIGTSRVWMASLRFDLGPVLAMMLIGLCATELGMASPLLIPALFVPTLLIHQAVARESALRKNTRESLSAMVEIVELRDPYTAGHSRRVAANARLIAQKVGLSAEMQDLVESAGATHDIGKVALDPAILLKTTQLDQDEWEQMRSHPGLGAEVLSRFESCRDEVRFVRSHHEAWDGTGYPDRLAGETIPLGARILAVADTFDALTSDRPYRNGMPIERAIAILQDGSGKQWDAEIVAAFLTLLETNASAISVSQSATGKPEELSLAS